MGRQKKGMGKKVNKTIDLKRKDFRGAHLAGADFEGADLTETNFAWANLRGANFARACLRLANLTGANLTGANLGGADLTEADFEWADLTGVKLRGANLAGANFAGAGLRGANLTGVKTQKPILEFNLKYHVIVLDDYIAIGCETHTIDKWRNFDDKQIYEMDGKKGAIFWKKNKEMIFKAIDERDGK